MIAAIGFLPEGGPNNRHLARDGLYAILYRLQYQAQCV